MNESSTKLFSRSKDKTHNTLSRNKAKFMLFFKIKYIVDLIVLPFGNNL